jgi:hypothetical protein
MQVRCGLEIKIYTTQFKVALRKREQPIKCIVKKFWEELIAYFPLTDTGRIKNYANNFLAAAKSLAICCLATKGVIHITEPFLSNDKMDTHKYTD